MSKRTALVSAVRNVTYVTAERARTQTLTHTLTNTHIQPHARTHTHYTHSARPGRGGGRAAAGRLAYVYTRLCAIRRAQFARQRSRVRARTGTHALAGANAHRCTLFTSAGVLACKVFNGYYFDTFPTHVKRARRAAAGRRQCCRWSERWKAYINRCIRCNVAQRYNGIHLNTSPQNNITQKFAAGKEFGIRG